MTGSAWTFSVHAGRFVSVPEAALISFLLQGGVRGGKSCRIGVGRRLADDGKRSDTVRSCTFYSASRREEKGEGLGEERARRFAGPEGWRISLEVDFGCYLLCFLNILK